MRSWIEVVCNKESGAEDGGADDRDLDSVGLRTGRGKRRGLLLVNLSQSGDKFATNRHPFYGLEIVVLEDEDEGRGAKKRSILPVELRFAVFGGLVRGWLCRWISS